MKLSLNRNFNNWLKRPAIIWVFAIVWLLVIGFFAFFWNLGATGLIDETEPLFAEAARQMTVIGDWITPYFNGDTRFDKPILIYWLIAIGYKILSVNTLAVRLPSALSAMGLVCLSFYTLLYFGVSTHSKQQKPTPQDWLCAFLGATAIALNGLMIILARIGTADALLAGCMGGALLSFFLGYAEGAKTRVQGVWYFAFYLLIALAILTKGPIGIVLPGLIIGAFLLYLGNWRSVLREMRPVWGSLLILIVTLPWYLLVTWRNGWSYINSFFGYHNLERFTSVVNRHWAPWYFYFLVVFIGFIPWSIYLPAAIANQKFWQRTYWRSSDRSTQLGLFALFWFVGVFGFFTIAVTKLPHYVLPLIPAAAILVAQMWSERFKEHEKVSISYQISGFLNVVLLLILAGVLFYSPNFLGKDPAIVGEPSQVIKHSGLPILSAIIWSITAVGIAVLIFQRRWSGLMIVNLLGFLTFLIFVLVPAGFLLDEMRQLPLRELSAIVTQVQQPGEPFFMVGFKKPSVAFYTQRKVEYILRPHVAIAEMKKMSVTVPSPGNLLIISNPKKLKEMGLQPSDYQNLGVSGAYQLVKVSKSKILGL